MKAQTCFAFALLVCAAPAFEVMDGCGRPPALTPATNVTDATNVTVYAPANGWQGVSPFNLSATASACSSQPIGSMGYSLDNSTDTTIVNSTSIDTEVPAPAGAHTLHVKSWGSQGSACVTDVSIVVVPNPTVPNPTVPNPLNSVPADAQVFTGIQAQSGWKAMSDPGTSGSAMGSMLLTDSPGIDGPSRQFISTFTDSGGELYYTSFGSNTAVSNFLYDGWVYIGGSSSGISNIEMDMNQVMSNGQTVIYGFQCDGWTNTWDYTENAGTASNYVDHWLNSNQYCNPRTWSTNSWHHVQISYSRDQYGAVTYKSVWMDGVEEDIYQTVPSSFALGWSSVLLTNFQVDGYGSSGSSTVYLGDLNVYAW